MTDTQLTQAGQFNEQLFAVLAEQVKLPFVHIAQAMELARANPSDDIEKLYGEVSLSTQAALRLIDSYLLNVRLQAEAQLDLEPVALSSVLYDTADQLAAYARAHDCELRLDIKGKYGPVMAHRPAVQAALLSLGYSFIDAAVTASPGATQTPVVTLAANKTAKGVTAGMFSDHAQLSSQLLKQGRILAGKARQPLQGFTAGSGAGVFLADALFARLDSTLRVGRFRGAHGLAASLPLSRQLSLV